MKSRLQFGLSLYVAPCDGVYDCKNTDIDEMFCDHELARKGDCDGVCGMKWNVQFEFCEDESYCNGYSYGLYCNRSYISAKYICDGMMHCPDQKDETDCNESNVFCTATDGRIKPIFNYTRCSVILFSGSYVFSDTVVFDPVCSDYLDQTNCSDPSRVGLHCPVHGYMSTVAQQVICIDITHMKLTILPEIPQICDDGLDKACMQLSGACNIHKHLMCDGNSDCIDQNDEIDEMCQLMSTSNCTRRYTYKKASHRVSFPMAWVGDGVEDCMLGEDEKEWSTCGVGKTTRYTSSKDGINCKEVFLCYPSHKFVHLNSLCDGIDSCSNENKICKISRGLVVPQSKALKNSKNKLYTLLTCLDGLANIQHLQKQYCYQQNFTYPTKTEVFGRNYSSEVIAPKAKLDCRHTYGEAYVFLSCLGLCMDSICPLVTPIRHNTCQRLSKPKIFTRDTLGNLMFLTRDHQTGALSDEIFVCRSGECQDYDKVCNLVADCGDGSDEELCTNNFQCSESKRYLPITQKCDGVIHCSDHSDECNESCGEQIISSSWLKVMAGAIGISSILLNVATLIKNIEKIPQRKSEAAFLNNCLVVTISVGDFLVGCYLLAITFIDRLYGESYCRFQLRWLTSTKCLTLGAISSFGSMISLVSMATLSLIRVSGLKDELCIPKSKSKKTYLKLGLILSCILSLSAIISFLPLIPWLEDFFINGLQYEESNKLFLGCPDKLTHMQIIQKYYGRIALRIDLKWSQIRELVKDMFSNDYGGIHGKPLNFFGNDGVCVFKFFVSKEDPQRNFVLAALGFILMCFIIIAVSYGTIATMSRKSEKELAGINSNANDAIRKNNDRLQRLTQGIIFTDFVCWIPFLITCGLHLLEIVDATPWYPVFTIIFMPINSVINPLIYDNKRVVKIVIRIWQPVKLWTNHLFRLLKGKPKLQSSVTAGVSPPNDQIGCDDRKEAKKNTHMELQAKIL